MINPNVHSKINKGGGLKGGSGQGVIQRGGGGGGEETLAQLPTPYHFRENLYTKIALSSTVIYFFT